MKSEMLNVNVSGGVRGRRRGVRARDAAEVAAAGPVQAVGPRGPRGGRRRAGSGRVGFGPQLGPGLPPLWP